MQKNKWKGSITEWNQQMQGKSPQDILKFANDQFAAEMVLACSFGAEDVALVDMYCKVSKQPRIFYLDTNKHFPETYAIRDRLAEQYGISFIQVNPEVTLAEQAEKYGAELWSKDPNLCCDLRKVKPLTNILKQQQAWVTGIRREQSPTRANAQHVEWDEKFQLVKFNPLATWTWADVWSYIRTHQVRYNPLHDQNYPSIGCDVCTNPVKEGADPRSGRWAGSGKTECGLHR
jgi:phosphoadenosine phosphosulfate reductase